MKSKWISVNKRIPTKDDADKDGLVLILRKGGAIREATYHRVASGGWIANEMMRVTHWARMLPAPKR